MNEENGQDAQTVDPEVQNEILRVSEQRIQYQERATKLALQATNGQDWTIIGDRPYLEISGTVKVARRFGVSMEIIKEPWAEWKNDEDPPYVAYHCRVKAIRRPSDQSFEDEGTATSKDNFFWRGGKAQPPEEVDLSTVRKKSITNAYNRAIKGLLGLRSVAPEDLEAVGIKPGKRVEFREGKQGGKKTSGRTITEKQKKRFWAIAKHNEPKWENDEIKELLKHYEVERTEDIPIDKYEEICKCVEFKFDEWKDQLRGEGAPDESDDAEL